MNIKNTITTGIVAVAMVIFASPTVTDVTAKQRYPWNGLVDITCKVSGINGTTNGLKLAMSAVMPDTGNPRHVWHFWTVQGGTNVTDRVVHTNGNIRLLWDARADLGQVIYTNMVLRVKVVELHGKVQLWEGGPYWATTNIGADEPWEYGYYFWWGDTLGYTKINKAYPWVPTDDSSPRFTFDSASTPTYGKDLATLQSEGWVLLRDGTCVLAPEHDAAQVQWGDGWRMPTEQELSDLNSKCDWIWTAMNGVNGYVVRGRGDYASSSIFLPAAGVGTSSLGGVGSYCYYWSAVPCSDSDKYRSWSLSFHNSGSHVIKNWSRYFGQPVRPVQGFTK